MKFLVTSTPSFPAPGKEMPIHKELDLGDGEKMISPLGEISDQLPLEIRRIFVGLELCVSTVLPKGKVLFENKENGSFKPRAIGVDGTPGYLTTKKHVVEQLKLKSLEAAEWIEENWLLDWFCFGHEEVRIIDSSMFHRGA